jgi:glycosyltransferase involved in cell wall biosynthesis/tetratricopeptide (TPR) repeat protein
LPQPRLWSGGAKTRRSETRYRAALIADPASRSALWGLGRLLLRERRFEDALPIWRAAVALEPMSAGPAVQLAHAYHGTGQLEEAAGEYVRALALDPGHEKAFADLEHLARSLARSKWRAERLPHLARHIENHLPVMGRLSDASRRSAETIARLLVDSAATRTAGDPELALVQYQAALRLLPGLQDALQGSAECHERLGAPQDAWLIWADLAQMYPEAVEPRLQVERLSALVERSAGARPAVILPARQAQAAPPRPTGAKPEARATGPGASPSAAEREGNAAPLRSRVSGSLEEEEARPALPPEEHAAILARLAKAREAAAVAPEQHQGILARARARLTGAPQPDEATSALTPQEREAILSRARADALITPAPKKTHPARRRQRSQARAEGAGAAYLDHDALEDLVHSAHSRYEAGDLDRAEAILKRLMGQIDRDARVLSLLSQVYLRRRLWPEAMRTIPALAAVQPEEARTIVRRALVDNGQRAELWLMLASIEAGLGDVAAIADAVRHVADAKESQPAVALAAARLSRRAGLPEEAHALYELAMKGGDLQAVVEMARFCASTERYDDALTCWGRLLDISHYTVDAVNNMSRIYLLQSRHTDLIQLVQAHAGDVCRDIDTRSAVEQNKMVHVVTRYVASAVHAGTGAAIGWLSSALGSSASPGPCSLCLRVRLFDSLGQKAEAEQALSQVLAFDDGAWAGVELDPRAELCIHAIRYGEFDVARGVYQQIEEKITQPTSFYRDRFKIFVAVKQRYHGEGPLLFPECLLEEILETGDADPLGYAPVPQQVMMVSGSLGQGGGEKQTVTVARSLVDGGAARHLYLAVRSLDRRPSDNFFVPLIDSIHLSWSAYGTHWGRVTDIAQHVPELATRPRLVEAIDLLPHNYREELVRVCRVILDVRPQVVHIWQDMPIVAVACLLCGVPQFFIHRGSLSPDYWEQNDHQWHTHFRPMRYIYKYLVKRDGFFFLNNSDVGCGTDANWIGVPKDTRFRVLYNAVQFEGLGEDAGPNLELRREIGIPENAPVVGGSFRLASVKRPRLWLETAKLVLAAVPDVHFVIIGGGEMTDEICELASRAGFLSRLHLPGRVAEVGAWYRIMSVKLLTSEREGIPNAIIEAQHFGVPVVATDVGGISEAIDLGVTGFVVKDPTAEDFAARVIAILSDPSWRENARTAAPAFVHDRFSLNKVLSQLAGYYGWDGWANAADEHAA